MTPADDAPRPIKQDELEALLTVRLEVETLAKQLKQAQEARDQVVADLIARLEAGATQAPGELVAGVLEIPGRRFPAWKDAYEKLAGVDAVKRVIAETAPSAARRDLEIMRGGRVVKTA